MQLSPAERWILHNQHTILAKLYPADAPGHARVAGALANGYEGEYDQLARQIAGPTLSSQQGAFVRDVLLMFLELQRTYDALPEEERATVMAHPLDFSSPRRGYDDLSKEQEAQEEAALESHHLAFPGFDGQTEPELLGYARWLVAAGGAFANLQWRDVGLNSHRPTRARYERMLEASRADAVAGESAAARLARLCDFSA